MELPNPDWGKITGVSLYIPSQRKWWIPTTDWYEDEGIEYQDGWMCPECGEWWDVLNGNPPSKCPDPDCGIELDLEEDDG